MDQDNVDFLHIWSDVFSRIWSLNVFFFGFLILSRKKKKTMYWPFKILHFNFGYVRIEVGRLVEPFLGLLSTHVHQTKLDDNVPLLKWRYANLKSSVMPHFPEMT